jgi:hypothetical protein
MGFFYNMMDKPIRLDEWEPYIIEGTIDKGAEWLNIGGLYFRNGVFSFDDFKLKIETKHGSWTDIPLIDAGFEEDVDSVNKVWKPIFLFFLSTRAHSSHCAVES